MKKEKREIAIASDHGGFELKKHLISFLKKNHYSPKDLGTSSTESVDYPEFAAGVALAVSSGAVEEGILICTSGIGMSIAANRFPNVRASVCHNAEVAKETREHNLSNILCLGAKNTKPKEAEKIVTAWLKTPWGKTPRYVRRANLIDEIPFSSCTECSSCSGCDH